MMADKQGCEGFEGKMKFAQAIGRVSERKMEELRS